MKPENGNNVIYVDFINKFRIKAKAVIAKEQNIDLEFLSYQFFNTGFGREFNEKVHMKTSYGNKNEREE